MIFLIKLIKFLPMPHHGMGKTRNFFKKIRDTKGTFHAKMSSIKDRNGRDLTETEDIKKRWQKYKEDLFCIVLLCILATSS